MTKPSSLRLLLLLLALPWLAACTELSIAIANAPTNGDTLEVGKDEVFDAEAGLSLDWYRPADRADQTLPVILFFYGGSWQDGDRADYRFVAASLAERGYLVVVPNYRKSPQVDFTTIMQDGARATRWVHDQLDRLRGNPQRFYLMGHSAGAHLAALLATQNQWLQAVDLTPGVIAGVVGLAGPYDFTPRAADIRRVFEGAPEDVTHLSRLVSGDEPPMLLQYGLADKVVGPQNHERLSAALSAQGVCHRVITYDGLGHVDLVSAFSWVYRDKRAVFADTVAFIANPDMMAMCP